MLLLLVAGQTAYAQPVAETDDTFEDLFSDEELGDEDLFAEEPAEDAPSESDEPSSERAEGAPATAPRVEEASPPPIEVEAPSGSGPSEGIEEILVQGQKTTGIEVDAAVSVTQFDSADLAALGVEDVSDVAQFTPNLEIRTGGATAPTFFIRGIGLNDFTANASGAIAIYQDDVAFSLPAIQLGQLFDVEQLDILRGPQGHGPARNASGGAIKIYSKKPSGEFGASLDLTYGRFNERNIEGALEVPLYGDMLAARASFIVAQRDPISRNRCAGAPVNDIDRVTSFISPDRPRGQQPGICNSPLRKAFPNPFPQGPSNLQISAINSGLEKHLDDADRWAARLQFRLLPPDTDMEWLLNVHGGKIDQYAATGQSFGTVGTGGRFFGGTTSNGYRAPEVQAEEDAIFAKLGGVGSNPPILAQARKILSRNLAERLDKKPFKGDFNRVGRERMATIGSSLRGSLELDWASITSITAFERYDRFRNLDADYTSDVTFEFIIRDRAWQISQELQISGELEAMPLRWNAGVLFLTDQLDFDNETVVAPPRQSLDQIYDQRTLSVLAFGGIEWDFLDDFTLEAGLRYNWERKKFEITLFRGGVPVCTNPAAICVGEETWQDPTGAIKLSYRFNDERVAYVSYNRGFKAGQYSVGGANGLVAFTLAEPETVDSFEVGFKGTFFDGALEVQSALFHYTYENYQVFLAANDANTPPQRVVVNADDAILFGGELETKLIPFIGWEALEPLEFTSRFGWIESEFLDFTQRVFRSNAPPNPAIPVDVDWTGNRLPNTPRFKWSGTLEYTLDMGRYGSLMPRWDWAWSADSFFDASDGRGIPDLNGQPVLPEFAIGQVAYWIHNVRIGWRNEKGNIELAGWVRNVDNKVYKTLAFDASEGSNIVGNLVGDPRTYGFTLSFDW